MKIFIYPYKQASASVIALKESMGIKSILTNGKSKFKGGSNKVVINWGSSKESHTLKDVKVLNKPECVEVASNKKKFFEMAVLSGVRIPPYTTDLEVVKEWLSDGKCVLAREKLQGHSGKGIIILGDMDEYLSYHKNNKAKVFTMYIPKKHEYRVHVVKDTVVDVQKKVLKSGLLKSMGAECINWKIRNHHNGFIYQRKDIKIPQEALDQAIKAISCCGLDFGAVDIIYNTHQDKCYVLEINTAPGLEGSSVEVYTKALDKAANNKKIVVSDIWKKVEWVPVADTPIPTFKTPSLTEFLDAVQD